MFGLFISVSDVVSHQKYMYGNLRIDIWLPESNVMTIQVLRPKLPASVGLITQSIINFRAPANEFGMQCVHI